MHKVSTNWLQAALDILDAARLHQSIEDFRAISRLKPHTLNNPVLFRNEVLAELIQSGVVYIDNSRLFIGELATCDWLNHELKVGGNRAWRVINKLANNAEIKRKFDQQHLSEIGLRGEHHVLSALYDRIPSDFHGEIVHVSQRDDTLGYDIHSPSTRGLTSKQKLEVKTSVRNCGEDFKFFISRNEARVGISDPSWALIGVKLEDDKAIILGFLRGHQIETLLPKDCEPDSRWESASIRIKTDFFRTDLP